MLTSFSQETCFDERGRVYNIPAYCFTHPRQTASSVTPGTKLDDKRKASGSNNKSEANQITLKIRINPGDKNFSVEINSSDGN
jgi:hypothetical protein